MYNPILSDRQRETDSLLHSLLGFAWVWYLWAMGLGEFLGVERSYHSRSLATLTQLALLWSRCCKVRHVFWYAIVVDVPIYEKYYQFNGIKLLNLPKRTGNFELYEVISMAPPPRRPTFPLLLLIYLSSSSPGERLFFSLRFAGKVEILYHFPTHRKFIISKVLQKTTSLTRSNAQKAGLNELWCRFWCDPLCS